MWKKEEEEEYEVRRSRIMMFFDATFLFMEIVGLKETAYSMQVHKEWISRKKYPHFTVLYQSAVKIRAFSKKGLGIFKYRTVADEE